MRLSKSRFHIALAMLCALMLTLLPIRALAYERVDTERAASLKLTYRYGASAIPGAEVRIYRVADVSDACAFVLAGDFASYRVRVNDLSEQPQWSAAAQTLAGYAAADGIGPAAAATTDGRGEAGFAGLKTGLYLILTGSVTADGYTYVFAPFLLSLPDLDEGSDTWMYDVSAYPKCERQRSGTGELAQYEITKLWADAGYESSRPASITVEILHNGLHYDTVTLSENRWKHSWTAEKGGVWQVAELDVKAPYTVSVTRGATAFVVTNTHAKSTSGGSGSVGGVSDGSSLPQTGQLWWPIAPMACAGMVLFGAGWALRQKGKRRETR